MKSFIWFLKKAQKTLLICHLNKLKVLLLIHFKTIKEMTQITNVKQLISKLSQVKQKSLLVFDQDQQKIRKNSFQYLDDRQNDINKLPGPEKVYTIIWYHSDFDQKYEVSFSASVDISIREFLQKTISEFNKYFHSESLSQHFMDDGNTLFELFLPKKKSGKPNEDFPPFDLKAQMKGTNQTKFSLKITQIIRPNLMVSDVFEENFPEEKKQVEVNQYISCEQSNSEQMFQQYKINPGTSVEQSDLSIGIKVSNEKQKIKVAQKKKLIFCCFYYDSD